MPSPNTWDLAQPPDNMQEAAFPALGRADKVTLKNVLGTLLPFGAPTIGARQVQIGNVVYELFNASYDGTNFQRDDTAGVSGGYRWNADGSADLVWAAAGANPIGTVFPNIVTWLNASKLILNAALAGAIANSKLAGGTGFPGFTMAAAAALILDHDPVSALEAATRQWVLANASVPTVVTRSGTGAGNYSTASTSLVDVDSTNLSYTVTIPVGQKMICQAVATQENASGTSNGTALVDGATVLDERDPPAQNAQVASSVALLAVIVGDGASHTIKLQYRGINGGTTVMHNTSAARSPKMVFSMQVAN